MQHEWVIPDIHGCYRTLQELLDKKIVPGSSDRIIFLGDYIDRGPASKQVLDLVQELGRSVGEVVSLKGNHEDVLVKCYDEAIAAKSKFSLFKKKHELFENWLKFGGDATLKSFGATKITDVPEEYIERCRTMPHHFVHANYLIVHAGLNFELDDPLSDTHAMMWLRDYKVDRAKIGGRKLLHGHTPVSMELIEESIKNNYDFLDLDNGCVYRERPGMGKLLAFELNTGRLVHSTCVDRV